MLDTGMMFVDHQTTLQSGSTIFVLKRFVEQWFEKARGGDRMVYATGDLGHDRTTDIDPGGMLNATALYVHKLARQDYVELTQRKLGECRYEYRIRKK